MTGAELRAVRNRLGYTQEQMADALAITQPAVSRMESGETRITPAKESKVRKLDRAGPHRSSAIAAAKMKPTL